MMSNKINAFIFDMDGVLIDSYAMHKKALELTAKEYGFIVSEDEFVSIFGKTSYEGMKSLKYCKDWSDEKIYEFNEKQDGKFRELFKKNPKFIDGALDFIKKLYDKKFLIGIGTSAPRENAIAFVDVIGSNGYFKSIITGDDVKKGKPDPEIYIKCSSALSQKPENCLVFEDSVMGIKSAKSAGMKVIGLTTTHNEKELSEADFIINNFKDKRLYDYLEKNNIKI